MAQEIYHRSEWGNPNEQWGNVYLNADLTNELYKRASEYENSWVTDQLLNGVGTKPSIILTPTAYEDGVLNSVKPSDGNADFQFSRNSSATRVNELGLVQDVQLLSGELVQNGNFEQIGSELVTNGGFDTDSNWVKQTGWSIANGLASSDGSQSLPESIYQNGVTVVGKIYKITYTIVSRTSGSVRPSAGTLGGTYQSTPNTYIEYLTATGNVSIGIQANADFIGSIDNVSVKEVGQNWTLGTGWSIGEGKAISDGTQTAYSTIKQIGAAPINTNYKMVFTADITSGSIEPSVGGSNSQGQISASGTYTFYTITSIGDNNLYFGASADFVGSITNISLIEITDDTDLPRINYTNFDYENGEVVPYSGEGSLLLEPQRTNSITYSNDFSQSIYGKINLTITANQGISPDGTQNANLLVPNAAVGNRYLTNNTGSNLKINTVFLKKKELRYVKVGNAQSNVLVDLENGTISADSVSTNNFTIENYGNGWYRVSCYNTLDVNLQIQIFIGIDGSGSNIATNGTDGVYIYGFEIQNGSYPTSYIPTTSGSTVTRLADVCNNSGSSDLINSTEGVLYAEIAALADDGTFRNISLNNGTTAQSVRIYYRNTTNEITALIGSASGGSVTVNVANAYTFNKIAVAYQNDNAKVFVNGVLEATIPSITMPTGLNQLDFDISNSLPFYGNVKCVAVFKEALSDTELQKLTQV